MPKKAQSDYRYCAAPKDGPMTPWHIHKPGDPVSLCGKSVSRELPTEISIHNLLHCCQKCAMRYEEVSKQICLL